VELEDVPDSVAELIEGELFRIDTVKENIGQAYNALSQDEPHLDLVAKSLDKARQTLGAIDMRLSECESILAGYERAINPPEEQPQLAPPPQTTSAQSQPRVHKYNPPYTVPKDEPAEDQQFDGETN
jgi:hypothetical protein